MWRWACASRRGTSHLRSRSSRQDAYRCQVAGQNADYIVAVVCDGAGSAEQGATGAYIASRHVCAALTRMINEDVTITEEVCLSMIDDVRDLIGATASRHSLSMREFASTLVACASNGSTSYILHVGDGAVLARRQLSKEWICFSWPETGEYASSTYFLTDAPQPRLRFTSSGLPIEAILVFSDGLERLALDFANRMPYEPFANTMVRPIAELALPGRSKNLSEKLGSFLDSEKVNHRTDDDKTLIAAALSA